MRFVPPQLYLTNSSKEICWFCRLPLIRKRKHFFMKSNRAGTDKSVEEEILFCPNCYKYYVNQSICLALAKKHPGYHVDTAIYSLDSLTKGKPCGRNKAKDPLTSISNSPNSVELSQKAENGSKLRKSPVLFHSQLLKVLPKVTNASGISDKICPLCRSLMSISKVNLPVIKENGDFYRYYIADIPFCSNCQNYYISEFAAKRILHQVNQGSGERYSLKLANAQIRRGTISDDYYFYPTADNNALIYNVNEKQETNTTNNSEYNLNSKSFLGEMGYSVNLSADIRHKILVSAIKQHGKRRVADHIAFLIQTRLSQAGGKAKYLHAISIWQNDLNFIARLFID